MRLTASELRENLDDVLDEVLSTGVPAEIEHRGQTLKIVAEVRPSKLDRLVPRPGFFTADPEETARIGWTVDGRWYVKPESSMLGPDDSNLAPHGSRV